MHLWILTSVNEALYVYLFICSGSGRWTGKSPVKHRTVGLLLACLCLSIYLLSNQATQVSSHASKDLNQVSQASNLPFQSINQTLQNSNPASHASNLHFQASIQPSQAANLPSLSSKHASWAIDNCSQTSNQPSYLRPERVYLKHERANGSLWQTDKGLGG